MRSFSPVPTVQSASGVRSSVAPLVCGRQHIFESIFRSNSRRLKTTSENSSGPFRLSSQLIAAFRKRGRYRSGRFLPCVRISDLCVTHPSAGFIRMNEAQRIRVAHAGLTHLAAGFVGSYFPCSSFGQRLYVLGCLWLFSGFGHLLSLFIGVDVFLSTLRSFRYAAASFGC
jgi:hypothetical protein